MWSGVVPAFSIPKKPVHANSLVGRWEPMSLLAFGFVKLTTWILYDIASLERTGHAIAMMPATRTSRPEATESHLAVTTCGSPRTIDRRGSWDQAFGSPVDCSCPELCPSFLHYGVKYFPLYRGDFSQA